MKALYHKFMNIKKIIIQARITLLLYIIILLSGCSTGIEGTKTITYSKSERKEVNASPEETFMDAIKPLKLKYWKTGKRFMISDNRAALVFEPTTRKTADSVNMKGRVITFNRLIERPTPGGANQAVISFIDDTNEYLYPTGKILNDALENLSSLDIPMLIDLDLIDGYKDKLEGLKLWTRSQLWYDENGEKRTGRKFVPVTITKVMPGDMLFNIHLDIKDESGSDAIMYMNPSNRGLESRTFANLFFLSDPKTQHSSIQPDVWELICNGEVKTGMTKEECKLSLGNPDDVNTGHDWNQTIEIWNYKNGSFLQFQDGLLTRYRI